MYNPGSLPSKANLDIYQGDDYTAVVTVTNGNGQAPDLTGYAAQAHIRAGPADSNPEVLVDIAASIAGNIITLSIPAATTGPLAGRFQWDLELVAPAGTVTTILAGAAIVTAEVTRGGSLKTP